MATSSLAEFVRESNRIEGITREPTKAEIAAHAGFLSVDQPTVDDLRAFVAVVQSGAILRDREGLNVRVGAYIAPRGGPQVARQLAAILTDVDRLPRILDPMAVDPSWSVHVAYERLHPFTDGNGRSGRTLWLWMHSGHAPLGFLHEFYYQTLNATP